MKDQTRNMNPHKKAVIAMWLFGKEYADLGLGSMDYYDGLSGSDKKMCKRMLDAIKEAPPEEEI